MTNQLLEYKNYENVEDFKNEMVEYDAFEEVLQEYSFQYTEKELDELSFEILKNYGEELAEVFASERDRIFQVFVNDSRDFLDSTPTEAYQFASIIVAAKAPVEFIENLSIKTNYMISLFKLFIIMAAYHYEELTGEYLKRECLNSGRHNFLSTDISDYRTRIDENITYKECITYNMNLYGLKGMREIFNALKDNMSNEEMYYSLNFTDELSPRVLSNPSQFTKLSGRVFYNYFMIQARKHVPQEYREQSFLVELFSMFTMTLGIKAIEEKDLMKHLGIQSKGILKKTYI